jgi:hypothetical protein
VEIDRSPLFEDAPVEPGCHDTNQDQGGERHPWHSQIKRGTDMIGTTDMFSTDETTFRVGDKVVHKDCPLVRGKITKITIPVKGSGVTRICVDPESLEALNHMKTLGNEWPTEGGGHYVALRDTGTGPWQWDHA